MLLSVLVVCLSDGGTSRSRFLIDTAGTVPSVLDGPWEFGKAELLCSGQLAESVARGGVLGTGDGEWSVSGIP